MLSPILSLLPWRCPVIDNLPGVTVSPPSGWGRRVWGVLAGVRTVPGRESGGSDAPGSGTTCTKWIPDSKSRGRRQGSHSWLGRVCGLSQTPNRLECMSSQYPVKEPGKWPWLSYYMCIYLKDAWGWAKNCTESWKISKMNSTLGSASHLLLDSDIALDKLPYFSQCQFPHLQN